jgi:hypothetical protein
MKDNGCYDTLNDWRSFHKVNLYGIILSYIVKAGQSD